MPQTLQGCTLPVPLPSSRVHVHHPHRYRHRRQGYPPNAPLAHAWYVRRTLTLAPTPIDQPGYPSNAPLAWYVRPSRSTNPATPRTHGTCAAPQQRSHPPRLTNPTDLHAHRSTRLLLSSPSSPLPAQGAYPAGMPIRQGCLSGRDASGRDADAAWLDLATNSDWTKITK